jgi:hypothetical protein
VVELIFKPSLLKCNRENDGDVEGDADAYADADADADAGGRDVDTGEEIGRG